MTTIRSMAELMTLIPEGVISYGEADAALPEVDDGVDGSEEKEVEEVEAQVEEESVQEVVPLPYSEAEPEKPVKGNGAWVKKLMALTEEVAHYKEIVDRQQEQIDFIRGRSDRLMEENSSIRKQLGKQADGAMQRQLDRLRNQLETLATRVNRPRERI